MEPDEAGTHLTPFERALGRFLMSVEYSGLTTLADLASAEVKHEPYWMSDSGTGWPEDTTVCFRKFGNQVRKDGSRGVGRRVYTVSASSYSPTEFMAILVNDYT